MRRSLGRAHKNDAMPKPSPKQAYIERVRNALTMTTAEVKDLPRADYIAALDEIGDELNSMAEAAREEATEDEGCYHGVRQRLNLERADLTRSARTRVT